MGKKYREIQKNVSSETFSITVLEKGLSTTLEYVNQLITYMRPEFINSVNQNIKGSYLFSGQDVIEPETMNEFLHFAHSYLISNDKIYDSIPIIKTTVQNNWTGVSLRGISNEIGNSLYETIRNIMEEQDRMDIINLEEKILIMARGLGHASVLEIDKIDENHVFVKYFIPKSINNEMIALLKGIKENNKIFAIGDFTTTKEKLVLEIGNLLSGIPRDSDYKKSVSSL